MAYRQVLTVYLGSSHAGKTLNIDLRDESNVAAGGAGLIGQFEKGTDGTYHFVVDLPDGHRGWVDVREGATVITSIPINPEEVVNQSLLNQIADAVLTRDWTAVGAAPARCAFQALRRLRNRWGNSGGTGTIYEEDDTTAAWTETLTTDGAAVPITGSDPN